jgi:hypothetical protein
MPANTSHSNKPRIERTRLTISLAQILEYTCEIIDRQLEQPQHRLLRHELQLWPRYLSYWDWHGVSRRRYLDLPETTIGHIFGSMDDQRSRHEMMTISQLQCSEGAPLGKGLAKAQAGNLETTVQRMEMVSLTMVKKDLRDVRLA